MSREVGGGLTLLSVTTAKEQNAEGNGDTSFLSYFPLPFAALLHSR
jgi:hypothetical protein